MDVFSGLGHCGQRFEGGSVLTLGNFDGVHRGHQEILAKVRAHAENARLPGVLLTFEPHPVQVLHPEKGLKRLFPLHDLETQVSLQRLSALVIEPFTRELAALPAGVFLHERVIQTLHPKVIVVGHDFSFGANREGTIEFLKNACRSDGIHLEVQAPIEIDGQRVSSRLIRELVTAGEMETARTYLGRPFYLEGIVEKGAGRGQTLGVPTLNMKLAGYVMPKQGVYVTSAKIGAATYCGVSNLGLSPTFGTDAEVKLETHLLEFAGNLYGQNVQIEFLKFLRAERKFPSISELKTQIFQDIEMARQAHALERAR